MTPEIASSLGIKDGKGAMVAEVVPGGPAAKAGFEQGDIVTAINGQAVDDATDLTRKVASVPAGQTATFNVVAPGQADAGEGHHRHPSGCEQGGLQRARQGWHAGALQRQCHGPGPVVPDAGSARRTSTSPTMSSPAW